MLSHSSASMVLFQSDTSIVGAVGIPCVMMIDYRCSCFAAFIPHRCKFVCGDAESVYWVGWASVGGWHSSWNTRIVLTLIHVEDLPQVGLLLKPVVVCHWGTADYLCSRTLNTSLMRPSKCAGVHACKTHPSLWEIYDRVARGSGTWSMHGDRISC